MECRVEEQSPDITLKTFRLKCQEGISKKIKKQTKCHFAAHLYFSRPERNDARRKIECAAAHFGSKQYKKKGPLEGVDYKVAATAGEFP